MYFYIYELKTVVLIFVLFRVAMEHLASLQAGHLLNPEVINQNQPANNRYGHRPNPEVVNEKQPVLTQWLTCLSVNLGWLVT